MLTITSIISPSPRLHGAATISVALTLALGWLETLAAQQLLVLNRRDDTAAVVDLATGRRVWAQVIGPDSHELALSSDGRFAYTPSYRGNAFSVLDLWERRLEGSVRLEGYANLHGVWSARTSGLVWVTAETQRALLEIEPATGRVLRAWDTEQAMSHMVVGTPDDTKLYVANIESGSVSVIDRGAETIKVIPTGAGAEGIDIRPDGREVWVSNNRENTVSVIDVAGDSVVATLASGGDFPVKLRFRPDGAEVWVSNNRSGTVSVFDTGARRLVETISVGPRPLGLAFSADSRFGFVTTPGSGEVVQIATVDRSIVKRIHVGASPDGIAWIDGPREKGRGVER